MELCQIWLELHHRVDFLFDCTIPRWCFQIYTSRNGYSFCPQGFHSRNSQFSGHEHFCQVQTQFSIFFFAFRKLNFENGSVKFQVSVFFFVIHVFTNMNRALVGMWRSTTRVRVTHFHYESGHLFVFIVENVTFN